MYSLHTVTILILMSVVASQYLELRPENVQAESSNIKVLQIPEYIGRNQNPTLSYTLQLPRTDAPTVQFYNTESTVDLQPPRNENPRIPLYYEYPEPSVELQAPSEGNWNPNNDPNLYYDNAPVVIDLETPTNLHPKKFVQDVHDKKYSREPKKEIILKPITTDDLLELQKTVDKLAKLENQKQVRKEKVSKKSKKSLHNTRSEPKSASTNFNDNIVEDISSSMIDSLGINALPGERFQFHMHGHKGPNSYKWGFDTGKGSNRQFRFEESDESGYVKGQYGYYDKSGKLHMFHYDAQPEGGFNSKSSTDNK